MSPSPWSWGSRANVVARTQSILFSGALPEVMSRSRIRGYGPSGAGPAPCVRSTQCATAKRPSPWTCPHSVTTIPATGPPDGHQFGTYPVIVTSWSVKLNRVSFWSLAAQVSVTSTRWTHSGAADGPTWASGVGAHPTGGGVDGPSLAPCAGDAATAPTAPTSNAPRSRIGGR